MVHLLYCDSYSVRRHRQHTSSQPDFFTTVFLEPDPGSFDSFDPSGDAEQCGIRIQFQPDDSCASHTEVARIITEHGEPNFDRLNEPGQRKD